MLLQEIDRLDFIFKGLAEGKLAHEIDGMLQERKQAKEQVKKKISVSENPAATRVAHILESVEGVSYVRRKSDEATFGNRYAVGVRFPGKERIEEITADIRAHGDAVRSFRRKISGGKHMHRGSVDTYLARQSMVLLHARLPEPDIATVFGQQLHRIMMVHNL